MQQQKLNFELLETYRAKGDPASDEAFRVLLESGALKDGAGALELLETLAYGSTLPKENQNILLQFLERAKQVPDWVDFELMKKGQKMFLRYAPYSAAVLLGAGLIESYTAAKGNKVLIATGRLKSDIPRRIYETGQMMKDIMEEDGIRPGNVGWRTMLKVRLMHSAVRYHLLKRGFDVARYGHPVNQEDMAITLHMFSYVELRGLETLGLYISEEEREGYHHLWRWCGLVLGVDPFFLTETPAAEKIQYETLKAHQQHPDEDSHKLAIAVLDAMAERPPFFRSKEQHYQLARFLVGDEMADALGIPVHEETQKGLERLRELNRMFSRLNVAFPLFDIFLQPAGRAYIDLNLFFGLGDKPAEFRVYMG